MAELVGKRYAEALFEVAVELNKLDEFKEEIKAISDILQNETELRTIFTHPKLSKKDKKEIMDSLFKGRVSQEMMNLLYIVIDKGREGYISDIRTEYIALANRSQGIIEAKAITAVSMDEEEKNKLQDKLSKKFNKKVILENIIDKKIIGGVLVEIGDKIIDASIKGQLETLEKDLKSVKVEKIGVNY